MERKGPVFCVCFFFFFFGGGGGVGECFMFFLGVVAFWIVFVFAFLFGYLFLRFFGSCLGFEQETWANIWVFVWCFLAIFLLLLGGSNKPRDLKGRDGLFGVPWCPHRQLAKDIDGCINALLLV